MTVQPAAWMYRTLVAALLAALLPCMLALRGECAGHYTRGQRYEDVYYLPPAAWLKPMALGFDDAAADLLWMRTLLYFGKEMIVRGQTQHIYNYIDAMLTLDPNFRAAYKWASMAGLYHAGTITAADGYRVVAYLERAVDRWPDDGEFYWELGSALRFELAPIVDDPVEKRRLYEAAMDPLATAARLGAGPPWLAGLNAQLFNKLGKTEQAIRHLEEMYDTVDDPREREQMQFQLAKLRSERYATAFQSATDELKRAREENYPYVPSNLFVLLGPRIDAARNASLIHGVVPQTATLEEDFEGLDEGAAEGAGPPP